MKRLVVAALGLLITVSAPTLVFAKGSTIKIASG